MTATQWRGWNTDCWESHTTGGADRVAANSNLVQEQEAVRRLVKSSPELWAQCSDAASLARHLSGFGEIRITRLEPENTVAWEGESASGTVTLEASGWGTRVRLTAAAPQSTTAGLPAPQPQAFRTLSRPVAPQRGLSTRLAWLLKRRRELPFIAVMEAVGGVETPEMAPSGEPSRLLAELEAALDSLGQAHHRPYSRS